MTILDLMIIHLILGFPFVVITPRLCDTYRYLSNGSSPEYPSDMNDEKLSKDVNETTCPRFGTSSKSGKPR